jgi:hypothetical protein
MVYRERPIVRERSDMESRNDHVWPEAALFLNRGDTAGDFGARETGVLGR